VLGQLVTAAEQDPRIGLVSPIFQDPAAPDVTEFRVAKFDPVTRIANQTTDASVARDWQENYPEQIVLLGTALLVRRALVETIGVLDEQFFAYVEDVDYSLRSTNAGFRNVAVPDAIVYHGFKRPAENPRGVPLTCIIISVATTCCCGANCQAERSFQKPCCGSCGAGCCKSPTWRTTPPR